MVKLKDIDGAQISKRTSIGPMGDDERDILVYNDAIDQQGSVDIGLNRERLAGLLRILSFDPSIQGIDSISVGVSRDIADAIILAEATLLEKIN